MRLPSREECTALVTAVGGERTAGKKLKSTSGWNDYNGQSGNGTNETGFSALPGGSWLSGDRGYYFYGAGLYGGWWTATEGSDDGHIYVMGMYYLGGIVSVTDPDRNENYGYSARCVQDD
jgi:uncharacterized protein (TIGR02145 family)